MTHQHFWIPSEHENFDRCLECGSYHNRIPFPKEGYLEGYWDGKEHSTLEEQRYNCENVLNEKGESKVQAVLKYCKVGPILEVACAPGSFLKAAREAGFEAEGIEPDERYSQPILDYAGCDVTTGFFEDIDLSVFPDSFCIVAMDLLEHLDDPDTFIRKCLSNLLPDGTLILMSPFLFMDGQRRVQDMHPEHMWIFSQAYLEDWLSRYFNSIHFDRWLVGHEIVVLSKPKFQQIPDS